MSDKAYADTLLTRYLLLTDKMLVDVFEVESSKMTQIDWFAHAFSQRLQAGSDRGPGEPSAPGDKDGYQHLSGGRAWSLTGPSQWDFIAGPKQRLRLWLAGEKQEQLFAATGIGYAIDTRVPCLIRRVHGSRARFITVYDLTMEADYILGVTASEDMKPHLAVKSQDGLWRIEFGRENVKCVKNWP